MKNKFDVQAAYKCYDIIMSAMDIKSPFTLDELITEVEKLRKNIDIRAVTMKPNVYGSAKLVKDDFYVLAYNQALEERLITRTILHELAHIAKGDVDKNADKICYVSRDHIYEVPEYDIEFICSMWLEQLVDEGTERATRLWFDGE
jgi:hypothetical protein